MTRAPESCLTPADSQVLDWLPPAPYVCHSQVVATVKARVTSSTSATARQPSGASPGRSRRSGDVSQQHVRAHSARAAAVHLDDDHWLPCSCDTFA